MRKILAFCLVAALLSSCAHVVSREVLRESVSAQFTDVQQNIDKFEGKVVVWGGFIARNSRVEDGTMLEVVENPLDRYGNIADTDVSHGRFLALYKGYLDPLIYKKNREVTIAGRVLGGKPGEMGDAEYTYPLLEVIEIYLWRPADRSFYPYYGPYYYDYPYWYNPYPYSPRYWRHDPWWYR